MTDYNYYEAVKDDIKVFIEEEYDTVDLARMLYFRNSFQDDLEEALWIEDSVTGNASGSYTCNAYKAEEYLCHNMDLLLEALEAFGDDVKVIKRGPEFCDVIIRRYLLPVALTEALDELEMDYASLTDRLMA